MAEDAIDLTHDTSDNEVQLISNVPAEAAGTPAGTNHAGTELAAQQNPTLQQAPKTVFLHAAPQHAVHVQNQAPPLAAVQFPFLSEVQQGQRVGHVPTTPRASPSTQVVLAAEAPPGPQAPPGLNQAAPAPQQASTSVGRQRVSILSYNLFFNGPDPQARAEAVGGIIASLGFPDFLCFQEVTAGMYRHLQQSSWWRRYATIKRPKQAGTRVCFTTMLWRSDTVHVSDSGWLKYGSTKWKRGLVWAQAKVGGTPVTVGTTHLESIRDDRQWWYREAQCMEGSQTLGQLAGGGDAVFMGDMNWNSSEPPPLPPGWTDAWSELHPRDPGLTFDFRCNPMLDPRNPKDCYRSRLDRAFCCVGKDWRLGGMELVGRQPIPGGRGPGGRPLLPSDHFGIFLKLEKLPVGAGPG